MPRHGGRSAALGALLAASGCAYSSDGPVQPSECLAPSVSALAVAPNQTNVLSVFVTGDARNADSVMVRFATAAGHRDSTPATVATGDSVVVPVLGLSPATDYVTQLVAFNRCGVAESHAVPFTTAALPSDLPSYIGNGSGPSPGYVVFAAAKYGLVIDNTGRVVWYHKFTNGPGLNFQAQPNGRFAARPPNATGEVGTWVEIAPDGNVTRTLGCAHDFPPRMHDLIAEPDGSYWLLCDETRTRDLSAQGASQQARVMGTDVQHRSSAGDLLFEWSPFDHFSVDLSVLDSVDRSGAVINWTHGNALDLDNDGNLLVSFRNLSEVDKIDTRSGAVVWRMGGTHNELAFVNSAVPAFVHQHGLRADGRGRILLLDNLGDPRGSHAERYQIDESEMTAGLSASYGSPAGILARIGGSAQALPNGHTLVSFGNGNGVEEYDAAGNVVWRLEGNTGYVFRAQRIRSLYRPGVGDPR